MENDIFSQWDKLTDEQKAAAIAQSHIKEGLKIKRPEWHIKGIISKQAHHLLLGKPHRLKSLIANAMAVSVATGLPFLGAFKVLYPGAIILIDEDTPTDTLQWRLERLAIATGHPLEKLPIRRHSMEGYRLDEEKWVVKILEESQEIKAVLLILDCLGKLHGDLDTNKADDMDKLGTTLNRFKQAGLTVVMTHHLTEKGREDEHIYDSEADFTGLSMGSTKIISNSDAAFGSWRVPGTKLTTFAVKKVERRFTMDIPDIFGIEILEDESKNWMSLRYRESIPRQPSKDAITVAEYFIENPTSAIKLAEFRQIRVSGEVLPINRTYTAFAELKEEGIIVGGEARDQYFYRLNPNFSTMDNEYANCIRGVTHNVH